LLVLATLASCDRNDYVTWRCKVDLTNLDEKPMAMILEGASMKIRGQIYNYCGSLGTQSYFDLNCSGDAAQSAITFISKTGTWKKGDEILNCVSL